MTYKKILKQLAQKENVKPKEIEKEMKIALMYAGINCNAKKFINSTANSLRKKTIYSK